MVAAALLDGGREGEVPFILPVRIVQPLPSLEATTKSIAHSIENDQVKYCGQCVHVTENVLVI
jgi:hypothetical protein